MNKDEKYIEHIEKNLDSLSSTTNWVIGSLLVIVLSILTSSGDSLKIFDTEIKKEYAALALFCFIIGLNFYILKLTLSIISVYDELKKESKEAAITVMRLHNWICNPFSKTVQTKNALIDSFGYAFFTIIWWLALILTTLIAEESTNKIIIPLMSSAVVYFFIGIQTALAYTKINKYTEFQNNFRKWLTWVAFILCVVSFIMILIFHPPFSKTKSDKKNKIEKIEEHGKE